MSNCFVVSRLLLEEKMLRRSVRTVLSLGLLTDHNETKTLPTTLSKTGSSRVRYIPFDEKVLLTDLTKLDEMFALRQKAML